MAKQIEELQLGYHKESNNLILCKVNKDGSIHKTVQRVFTKEAIVGISEWFLRNQGERKMLSVPFTYDETGESAKLKLYAVTDPEQQAKIEEVLDITDVEDL